MNQFTELKKVLEHSRKIPFYRKFYKELRVSVGDVNSFEVFKSLPFISKKDVMGERLFASREDIAFTRATSGTSGQMAVFHRSYKDREIHLENFKVQAPYYLAKENRVMLLFSTDLAFIFGGYFADFGCEVCFGDIYDLAYSAELLLAAEIDTIRTTPILSLKMGRILKQRGYSSKIKNVILSGSLLSALTKKSLEKLFPAAKIIQNYGLAETGLTAWQCSDLFAKNQYHLFPDNYLYEIIDPETLEPVFSTFRHSESQAEQGAKNPFLGELVISTLWTGSGNTLIRYRTGDIMEVLGRTCSCSHPGPTVAFRGRARFDVLKLKGLTLYKDTFEAALTTVASLVEPEYQIHLSEKEWAGKVLPRLLIKLIAKPGVDKQIDKGLIEGRLMENFKLTADYSFRDGVEKGLFLPLEVEFVPDFGSEGRKLRNIIDHRVAF